MTLAPIEIRIDYRLTVGGDVIEGIVFEQGEDKVCTRLRETCLPLKDSPHVSFAYQLQLGKDMDTMCGQSVGEIYVGIGVHCADPSGRRRGRTSNGGQQWRAHRTGELAS